MPAVEERLAALEESKRLTEMQDLANRMSLVEGTTAKILENVTNHIPTQIAGLQDRIDRVGDGVGALKNWIMGLALSVILALLTEVFKLIGGK